MSTADKLQNILDTKTGLQSVIEDNGGTTPKSFSYYPSTLDNIIDNLKGLMIVMDTIIINKNTTEYQLNLFFENLPDAGSYTALTQVVTIGSGVNVRSSGSSSGTALGKVGKTDVIPILGTASSGWYRINRYRYGTTTAAYDNPLKTYNNNSAYISNNVSENVVSNQQYPLKQIDISNLPTSVQQSCNYKIAEAKGWIVMFSTGSGNNSGQITSSTVYTFNNCYTDNYSDSRYKNKIGTNTSVIRQGYWSGYNYYKGNIRFTNKRLSEVKAVLNNSSVTKMELYLQRETTDHGSSAAASISLFACNSSGSYSDYAISTSATLTRGDSTWITLPDAVKSGFATGKYDHFKVYKSTTSTSYYIVYKSNAKLRLTYTT